MRRRDAVVSRGVMSKRELQVMVYISRKNTNAEDLLRMSNQTPVNEFDEGIGSFGNVGDHRSLGDRITAGNDAQHDSDPNDKATSEARYNGNR
jgi:hypothetical protein